MKICLAEFLEKKLYDEIRNKFVEISGEDVTEEGGMCISWRINSSGFFNIYLDFNIYLENQNILSGMIQMVEMEGEGEEKE